VNDKSGSEAEMLRDGAGVPVVVTVKENGLPTMAVAEDPLVMAAKGCSMEIVKDWVAVPAVLVAVSVTGLYRPTNPSE
jgi:hypothetical protein